MRCVNSLLALTLLAGCATHALALPSDSSQPIRIQADSATLDDKRNTAVYTGNVIITQGSMRLTGGRVSSENFTHGTSQQRSDALRLGLRGDDRACDAITNIG